MTDTSHSAPGKTAGRGGPLAAVLRFAGQQLWAGLFGVLILSAILVTRAIWQDDWPLARYDALVIFAVATQALMLACKLETWEEARVILLFHLTGTAMEWFKVSAGSWSYPEAGVIKLMGVPLFTGFMYASLGSYIARSIRLYRITLAPFPPFWAVVVLAVAIYVNFFAHHFLPDIRLALFAGTLLLFWRTRIHVPGRAWAPRFPAAAVMVAGFLWLAENIGTLTGTWAYAGQSGLDGWQPVRLSLLGSWYLLFHVAFATVLVVYRDACRPVAAGTDA